jgi:uncharacterized membrane protein
MNECDHAELRSGQRVRLAGTVALITVAGAVLRLSGLGGKSLWLDEIITADVIRGGPGSIIEYCLGDTGPMPFSYLFIWLSQMVHHNEFFLRLPDCLAGIATIPFLFHLGQKLSGRADIGVLAALLIATLSYHQYYSQEARGYALLAMLFCASFYVLLQALERRSAILWIVFILLSFVMTFTSYFGAISFGALILYGGLRTILGDFGKALRRRNLVWLLLSAALCGTPFLLWVMETFSAFRQYGVSHRLAPHSIAGLVGYVALSLRDFAGGSVIAAIILYGLVLLGWWKLRAARSARLPQLAVLLAALPLAAIYVSGVGHFLNPRFLIPLVPIMVISGAMGIWWAWDFTAKNKSPTGATMLRCCIVLLIAVYVFINLRGIGTTLTTEKQDWRAAAKFVEQRFEVGDFIVGGINAGSLCIAYYVDPDLKKAVLEDYYFYKPLQELLLLDRRVWYVTAYYRSDASRAAFYTWIDQNFDLMCLIPGSMDSIYVFLSKPNRTFR